jgi:hypothetical protein
VGTSAATYTYTPVDADAGTVFSVACTVTAVKGTVISNIATLNVQVDRTACCLCPKHSIALLWPCEAYVCAVFLTVDAESLPML